MVTATKPDMVSEEYWENLIKKSASRYFLLGMLFRKPMHGYEIAKTIEDCCEGWCKPTDGMIYPTLKEMVAGGYIECESEVIDGRVRKVCHLTDKGREAYRSAARVWASVLPYLNNSVKEAGATVDSACGCCGGD
ncbi:MAG: PadR family transcriptional regulator [Chloroflexi bacterium]|nr:PadR family transcriptional regulator [Chloroflexota bacterium]MCI0886793.1 PadR family transcriptional regulator [Chloroflexota bacterium]